MATQAVEPVSRDRAALVEALRNLNDHAKRQPRAIKLFEADPDTKWDAAHKRVNEHLTLLELS